VTVGYEVDRREGILSLITQACVLDRTRDLDIADIDPVEKRPEIQDTELLI
jgi:hypothetical protein